MKQISKIFLACSCCITAIATQAQEYNICRNDFSNDSQQLNIVGRGVCMINDGVFHSQGAYALFGNPDWDDYCVSFKARAPKDAEQVQIWAGFRTYNRFDRYVVGIKGGLQDDIYLMRTGYMGTDEFLGVRPLGFHPVPGEWYKLKVEVCGNRIRVFVNNEKLPHIDLEDKNSNLAPTGEVALGGGWIDTEFDNLTIMPLAKDALRDVKVQEYRIALTAKEKEEKRRKERAEYTAVRLDKLSDIRTELSLDGNWLFMPEYQLNDKNKAVSMQTDDNDWHIMPVPSFWNPIRIWLHGETMPSPSGPQHKGISDTYYQQETDRCENYTFDYRKTNAAWYRQWLDLPVNVKGKQMVLSFDAVSKMAEVYINGELAGSNIGMFGDFQIDATKLLHPGRNLISIKVTRDIDGKTAQNSDAMENYYSSVRKEIKDNQNDWQANKAVLNDIPHGFYGDNPAGIWQPVTLIVSNPLKVEDIFIKPALDGASIDVTVKNHAVKKKNFGIRVDIIDKQTGETLYGAHALNKLSLATNTQETFTCDIKRSETKALGTYQP